MRKVHELADLPEESVLLARARSHDQEAFGALVGRYEKALEGILVAYTRDRHLARDLVQEAVLRAFKNLHRYREEHKFSTWFFRIGVNLAITLKRRQAYEKRLLEPGFSGRETSPDPETPFEAALRFEDRGRLESALGRLPDRYQDILRLRYSEGLECKEIAKRLKTTANTVSIVLFRAKQRLREDLEREGEPDEST